ncbi:MAG: non-canonical purine NTP pyrophosphatase [bacterium]|nr:non-canonical purine NTP pyrophosphatase [bacterium]
MNFKYSEILLASNNKSKKARFEKIAKVNNWPIVFKTPEELKIATVEVPEEGNLVENARDKVLAYKGKTTLAVLGGDTGFFVDGKELDGVRARRNALSGQDEKSLSQERIVELMVDFYSNIAQKNGGEIPAYFLDAWALLLPTGDGIKVEFSRRDVILTDKVREPVDIYFPIRSLYRTEATGKRPTEQTAEEEIKKEFKPIGDALIKLLS